MSLTSYKEHFKKFSMLTKTFTLLITGKTHTVDKNCPVVFIDRCERAAKTLTVVHGGAVRVDSGWRFDSVSFACNIIITNSYN